MNRWMISLAALAVAAFVAVGCSEGSGSPVMPAADHELTSESRPTGQTHTHLWGYIAGHTGSDVGLPVGL